MKVPTYERQVGETADTGSRMLSAQANPNAMAAPFQAAAELGQKAFNAGLQWYGHELKLKRSIEENNASTTLAYESKRLANRITLGETQEDGTFIPPVSPKDMTSVYKLELNKIVQNLNTNFKDKVAQKRFMAKVSSLVAFFAATGLVLGATYMLWLYRRVVFGRAEKGAVISMPVLNNREITILVPLTIFIVWFGIYPAPLLDVLNPVVALISEAVSNTQMATANLQ